MTISEAAQLVLQAGAMAGGGDVFVLDMGEPVKILDLAHRMVELSGMSVRDDSQPAGDIEIVITGLRPGEKLYEELLIGNNPSRTTHPRVMKAQEDFLMWPVLQIQLDVLRQAVSDNDASAIARVLTSCVQGYVAHHSFDAAPQRAHHVRTSTNGQQQQKHAVFPSKTKFHDSVI